jgi:hypothetical protein
VTLCLSCSTGKHALCATCLNGYVLSEIGSNKKRLAENYGFVKCPVPGCDSVGFSQYELSHHLSQGAFEAYMTAWRQCMGQQAAQKAAEPAQQQQSAHAALDTVAQARSHIINFILTLKCPTSSKAFNGLYHVLTCPHDSIPDSGAFADKRLIHQYLKTLSTELRGQVLAAVEQELQGIGIDVESLCAELLERTSEPELAAAACAELEQETRLHLAKLAAAQQKEAPLCAPRAAVWAAHERRLQQRLRRAQWQQRSIQQQQLLQQLTEVMTVLGTVVAVLLLLLYCVYPEVLAAAAQVELWFVSNLVAAAAQVKLFLITNLTPAVECCGWASSRATDSSLKAVAASGSSKR